MPSWPPPLHPTPPPPLPPPPLPPPPDQHADHDSADGRLRLRVRPSQPMLALSHPPPAERTIKPLPQHRIRRRPPPALPLPAMPPKSASSAASLSPSRSHTSHTSHSTTASVDLSYLTHATTLSENDPDLPRPPAAQAVAPDAPPLPALLHDLQTSSAALLKVSQRAVDVFAAYMTASPAASPGGAPGGAHSEGHLAAVHRLRSAIDAIRQHSEAFLSGATSSVGTRASAHHAAPPCQLASPKKTSWDTYALDLWGRESHTVSKESDPEPLLSGAVDTWHPAYSPSAVHAPTRPACLPVSQEPDGDEETNDDEYVCDPAPWSRCLGNNKKRKSIRAKSDDWADTASDDGSNPASPALPVKTLSYGQQRNAGPKAQQMSTTANRVPHSLPGERQVSRRPGLTCQKAHTEVDQSDFDCFPNVMVSSTRPLQLGLDPPKRRDGTPWPDPQAIKLPGLTTRIPVPIPGKKKKLSKAEKKAKVHTKSRGRRPTLAELRARVQGAKADDHAQLAHPSGPEKGSQFSWSPPTATWPVSSAPPLVPPRPLDWLVCSLPPPTGKPFTFLQRNCLPPPAQVPQLAHFAPSLAPTWPDEEHECLVLFQEQLAAALAPVTEAVRHLAQARGASQVDSCEPDGPDSEPVRLIRSALEAIALAQLAIPPALLAGLDALDKVRSQTGPETAIKPIESPLFLAPRPAESARPAPSELSAEVRDPPPPPTEAKLTASQTRPSQENSDAAPAPEPSSSTTTACTEQEAAPDAATERPGRKSKPKKLSRRKKAAMNNVHHRCNWSQRGVGDSGESKPASSHSPQRAGNDVPTGCLDHPNTSNALFPNEYICLFCDYKLLYGEEPRMLASIRRRVRVEESRSWARARAHRLAKGQCPHDAGCGCADSPYPD